MNKHLAADAGTAFAPGLCRKTTRRALRCAALALLLTPPWLHLAVAAGLVDALPAEGSGTPVQPLGHGSLSEEARALRSWIAASNDHAGSAFVIVDKKRARLLVFDAGARLRASSPVLLGAALGDDSVEGIGERPIALVLPAERTTPAGRFVAERGRNTQGEDVIWVDYDAAVSMHRVRTGNALERRAERLATPSIDDNRISYGCINVPVAFYEAHVRPLFATHKAVVYVLPDTKPLSEVFSSMAREASLGALGADVAGPSLPALP